MQTKLNGIKEKAISRLKTATTLAEIEALRVEVLGKKSELTLIMREMGALPAEERPKMGALVNTVRGEIEFALNSRKNELERDALAEKLEKEKIDVTIPGTRPAIGKIHPLNKVLRQICDIFVSMGFEIVSGPEVETDYYNFTALNIPESHPARDEQDTFYIEMGSLKGDSLLGKRSNGGMGEFCERNAPAKEQNEASCDAVILRTQTSPVQIRTMEKKTPPIRIIAPGRVYRSDAVDATHSPMFHQIEGLVIDKGVTMGNLKGCLAEFTRRLYGDKVETRFRPHHFQFTEPSAEMDISCPACSGKGCGVCKGEGWIEILGAGMVHRDVLKRGNIDPDVYSGFAFGLGLERIAMRSLGINDLRLFFENDVRFLEQF